MGSTASANPVRPAEILRRARKAIAGGRPHGKERLLLSEVSRSLWTLDVRTAETLTLLPWFLITLVVERSVRNAAGCPQDRYGLRVAGAIDAADANLAAARQRALLMRIVALAPDDLDARTVGDWMVACMNWERDALDARRRTTASPGSSAIREMYDRHQRAAAAILRTLTAVMDQMDPARWSDAGTLLHCLKQSRAMFERCDPPMTKGGATSREASASA